MIRLAKETDLEELDLLAQAVIKDMMASKIPQWDYSYPRYEHFKKDVLSQAMIVFIEDNKIYGCMTFLEENDPPYKTISSWKKDHSIVLHRILVDPFQRAKGIAQKMLDYAVNYGTLEKYDSIKIDTHLENYKMRSFLKKNGFIQGDYIEVMDRIAYELILEDRL